MVADGADYPWSSASYHLSGTEDKTIMADYLHDSVFSYREFFYKQERAEDMEAIREAAQQGKGISSMNSGRHMAETCSGRLQPSMCLSHTVLREYGET